MSVKVATAVGVRRHGAKQPRGDWPDQSKYTAGREGSRSTRPTRTCRMSNLKPLETRPHHVSGARKVAAPVPRMGEQAQGLKTTTRAHTQRVEDDAKPLRTERE